MISDITKWFFDNDWPFCLEVSFFVVYNLFLYEQNQNIIRFTAMLKLERKHYAITLTTNDNLALWAYFFIHIYLLYNVTSNMNVIRGGYNTFIRDVLHKKI